MITFRSKVDLWLAVLLGGAAMLEIGMAISMLWFDIPGRGIMTVLFLAAACLILWILFQTVYHLGSDSLHVRSGPISFRIPLDSITGIKPTRNPLSSPALSLDRLQISYGQGKSCMISPNNKAEFLAELRNRGVNVG